MAIVAKVVCLVIAFMVATTPAIETAIKCDYVTIQLVPCVSYMKGGPGPTSTCCGSLRTLDALSQTTQQRLILCECLKSYIASIPGLNVASATALPGKCGVSILFPIGPNFVCLDNASLT